MAVGYEWDVETVDEHGDIIDHDFRDTYAECVRIAAGFPPEKGCHYEIVLVRRAQSCFDGNAWAYMEDGKLPTHFLDAYDRPVAKVPQKFHNEVAKVKEAA